MNLIKVVHEYGKTDARWSWSLCDFDVSGFSDHSVIARGTADDQETAERAAESVRRLMEMP